MDNLQTSKATLQSLCIEVLDSDFDGLIELDDDISHKFSHILRSICWDGLKPTEVACICNITPTALYKIKNGESGKLSQKTLMGLMAGLFDAKLAYKV